MGRMTREHRLGVTVNPADIDAFAAAIRRFLSKEPVNGFDRERALAYARASSVARFNETLFGTLEGYLSAPEPLRELPQRRAGSE